MISLTRATEELPQGNAKRAEPSPRTRSTRRHGGAEIEEAGGPATLQVVWGWDWFGAVKAEMEHKHTAMFHHSTNKRRYQGTICDV